MWPKQSHTLATLTKLTSIRQRFKWTQVELDAFDEIKRIMALKTFLTYPDFNETFKSNTDASEFQLGAVISQKDKFIDFYSRKLTDSQQRYTVTGEELIRIVETLKDLRTIPLGQKLRIYTDNKNIICNFLIPIEY